MPTVSFVGDLAAVEKLDGTSSCIILTDGGYELGCREELLHWADDRVWNPSQTIVGATKAPADRLRTELVTSGAADGAAIRYGAVFGGKTTASGKQYTSNRRVGWRPYDVARITGDQMRELLAWSPERIAIWRNSGGPTFLDRDDPSYVVVKHRLDLAPAD
jgi:hypothetical protein